MIPGLYEVIQYTHSLFDHHANVWKNDGSPAFFLSCEPSLNNFIPTHLSSRTVELQ